jgi:hypothetical protein
VSNKKAEEEKKRQKEGVEFAVQQLERVGYNDVRQVGQVLCWAAKRPFLAAP